MKDYNLDYFNKSPWTFVLIKNGKIIFRAKNRGITPLIFCLKRRKKDLKNAVVFDKIIGRAAAMLLAYAGVKKVMTSMASREALILLRENRIDVEYKIGVKHILNRKGSGLCPMEKLSRGRTAIELLEVMEKAPVSLRA